MFGGGHFLLPAEQLDGLERNILVGIIERGTDDAHRKTGFKKGADHLPVDGQGLGAGIDGAMHQALFFGQGCKIKPVAGQEFTGPLDCQRRFMFVV